MTLAAVTVISAYVANLSSRHGLHGLRSSCTLQNLMSTPQSTDQSWRKVTVFLLREQWQRESNGVWWPLKCFLCVAARSTFEREKKLNVLRLYCYKCKLDSHKTNIFYTLVFFFSQYLWSLDDLPRLSLCTKTTWLGKDYDLGLKYYVYIHKKMCQLLYIVLYITKYAYEGKFSVVFQCPNYC